MRESKTLTQYIAASAAALAALLAGIHMGWTNPAQKELMSGDYGFNMTEFEFSWVGSAFSLGGAIICVPAGIAVNAFGPKLTMLVFLIPLIIGWSLILLANSVQYVVAGRFLLGVASGTAFVAAPLYIGEIAQKEIRGKLGSFFQLNLTIGILFVYVIGSTFDVKTMSIICAVLPLLFGVIFIYMPETPTYLIGKQKVDAAVHSMQWLRGKDYDTKADIAEIIALDTKIKKESISFGAAMARPASKKALIIGIGLVGFQQLFGINAVIFYSTDIFLNANTGLDANLATIFMGVIQVIATFTSAMVVDKLGRRNLLLVSAAVMAMSTGSLGLYFYMKDQDEESVQSISWLPVMSVCNFIVMTSIGFGPVPYLMMGEIFSPDIKGVAASISMTVCWALAFVVTKTFVNLKEALGNGPTFWLFAAITVVGFFFVLFVVPETKNKTLNEIQSELERKSRLFTFRRSPAEPLFELQTTMTK